VLSTLAADAAVRVRGVRAVPEIVPSPSCQSVLKRSRPLLVGLGETPHLVRSQAEILEHCTEWLAIMNRVEELLSHLGR